MKAFPFYVFTLCLHLTISSQAQPGHLDTSFGGGDGVTQLSIDNRVHNLGSCLSVQADGRILMLGASWNPFQTENAFLARFRENGSIDSTFNGTGKMIFNAGSGHTFGGYVHALPDGKIITVIMFSTEEKDIVHIYRLMPDGTPDVTFDEDGLSTIDTDFDYLYMRGFALQPDGKMVLAGYAGYLNNAAEHLTFVRLLPDGAPDSGFDQDGLFSMKVGESYLDARSIAIQPDGKIIAAGYGVFEGGEDIMMVRILPQGIPDPAFGQQGVVRMNTSAGDDRCNAMNLQPDGCIVLGCNVFNSATGKNEIAVMRCMPDGSPDPSFDDDGLKFLTISGHSDGLRSLLLQPDGKILMAGYVHSDIPGGADMAIVRINQNGSLDMSFHEDGVAVFEIDAETSTVLEHLQLHGDGRIIGTGRATKDGDSKAFVAAMESGLTVSVHAVPFEPMDIRVYPNPASDFIHISFLLSTTQPIAIQLLDIKGQWLQTLLPASTRSGGVYEEIFSISGLCPGTYVLVLETDNFRQTMQVIVH